MPRTFADDIPPDVLDVAKALLELSHKEGMTRPKLGQLSVLLRLADRQVPEGSVPERVRVVEDMIRTQVNSIWNLRDRALLAAGLNFAQKWDESFEDRINGVVWDHEQREQSLGITQDSAQGRFRYKLTVELAYRLLGGAPVYVLPRPPSNDLQLAERLCHQHDTRRAIPILQKMATSGEDDIERREAWRLLAIIAYESGDYDGADIAFNKALQFAKGMRRGGKLAMAIDRYARLLTEEEQYDRAIALLKPALSQLLEGRWLWRRYGCVKWYAGELLDAYAALTVALDLGYPLSRVVHARGQVLAEMGRYRDAIEQLDLALSFPRSKLSAAIAHSAHAFAVGMLGDLDAALDEFNLAEAEQPDSGWLHYWRGVCLLHHECLEKGTEELQQALLSTGSKLNRPKREHAKALLAEMSTEHAGRNRSY